MVKFLSRFETPRFKPQPAPLPQRTWSNKPIDPQTQSLFFTRLPAEIRNTIYHYVFQTSDPTTPSQPPSIPPSEPPSPTDPPPPPAHPLSLLLTCRKANQEATILAFHTHTFAIPQPLTTFLALRHRTSLLSPQQLVAISSHAHDVTLAVNATNMGQIAASIANSLLAFPGLASIELRIQRSAPFDATAEHGEVSYWGWVRTEKPPRVAAWLHTALEDVVLGRSVSWQAGAKWSVEWVAETAGSGAVVEAAVACDDEDAVHEAVEQAEGIELCACGCGMPSWREARLVQEGGRKVDVKVVYYGDPRRELESHLFKLVPGVEPLPVTSLPDGDGRGFGWDGEKEYWDRIRRKCIPFQFWA